MAGRPHYAHLCAASFLRAMPENEIPPAMRVDFYYVFGKGKRFWKVLWFFSVAERIFIAIATMDGYFLFLEVSLVLSFQRKNRKKEDRRKPIFFVF